MKNKKCKHCNGTGMVFSQTCSVREGNAGFRLYEFGIKTSCKKCFGKGHK
ncbi:hypothetical protein [Bacillus wiedmannii]|nr:hypothetical protein [Bacillus wiedmannii]